MPGAVRRTLGLLPLAKGGPQPGPMSSWPSRKLVCKRPSRSWGTNTERWRDLAKATQSVKEAGTQFPWLPPMLLPDSVLTLRCKTSGKPLRGPCTQLALPSDLRKRSGKVYINSVIISCSLLSTLIDMPLLIFYFTKYFLWDSAKDLLISVTLIFLLRKAKFMEIKLVSTQEP